MFIIEDDDDQNPQFSHDVYELWLPEENASLIGRFFETTPPIFAYDLDFGINATIEYAMEQGQMNNPNILIASFDILFYEAVELTIS